MPDARLTQSPRHCRGFTLVELLIVLAVFAIMVSLAAPPFMNIIASNRVSMAANELVGAINLGKAEATRDGLPVVMCQSNDGTQCHNDRSAWANGWILFQDDNGNNTLEAGERIIRVSDVIHPSLAFRLNEHNNTGYLRFSSTGRLNRVGTFCFENSADAANSRRVVFTQAGRIRTDTWDAGGNCQAG